jgi:hypothetical protein
MHGRRTASVAYWSVAVSFTVFGFLDLIAIGAPFFLTGLAMIAVGRHRHDPAVLWPALTGVWAFVLGYALTAPLGCTTSPGGAASGSGSGVTFAHTWCTNVLGLDYSGGAGYRPPLLPAFLAGIGLGLAVALTVRWVLSRRAPVRTA